MAAIVSLNTKVLDALIKQSNGLTASAIARTAFTIERLAKMKAPVDTGALRASIYTSLYRGSMSAEAMADAQSRRPGTKTTPLPVPQNDWTAFVGPSVEYGADVEFGSVRRSGTPYLQPAARETEELFLKELGEVISGKT